MSLFFGSGLVGSQILASLIWQRLFPLGLEHEVLMRQLVIDYFPDDG
jgi:hypothetical protein